MFLLSYSQGKIKGLETNKRKRTSEIREGKGAVKTSSRTPNLRIKLWDWQQNFSGLPVIYVPHIQASLLK